MRRFDGEPAEVARNGSEQRACEDVPGFEAANCERAQRRSSDMVEEIRKTAERIAKEYENTLRLLGDS